MASKLNNLNDFRPVAPLYTFTSGTKVVLTWKEWFKSWGLWIVTLGSHTRSQNEVYRRALRAKNLAEARTALQNGASVDCISPKDVLTADAAVSTADETALTAGRAAIAAFVKAQQQPYKEEWALEVTSFQYTYNAQTNTLGEAW